LDTFTIEPNNNQWVFIYFPFPDDTDVNSFAERIEKDSQEGAIEFCDFRLIHTSTPLSTTL
jgi:hypothetical protein